MSIIGSYVAARLLLATSPAAGHGLAARPHRREIRVLSKGFIGEYPLDFYSIDTEFAPADGPLVMDIHHREAGTAEPVVARRLGLRLRLGGSSGPERLPRVRAVSC